MDLPAEVVLRVLRRGLTPEGTAKLLQDYSDIRAKVLDRDKKIAKENCRRGNQEVRRPNLLQS